ncbi:meiosis-specific protein ASY3 isoform X2 [Telopea speciosissima]|uniref:meiosis-specific protein ASY3 isoform X2 n=1 Tax=Telopea speciosissima TaxID=54955 RepID=UPI001CC41AEC|nr:meiosis-specific protein ASY3 isoform X2 [Telopea speciosissima]
MEPDRRSYFQDDRRSTCRSFGSNNHPCSQSRKMSIGVMVDQTVKLRTGDGEEKVSALSNTEKVTSNRGKLAEDKNKSGMVTAMERKQAADPLQEVSPWINTRSLHQETPTAKTVNFYAKQTSVLRSANGTQKKFSKANGGQMTVHFYANQTSILHSVNGVGKKLDSVTDGRALGNDGTTARVEESAFAATLEVCVPDGGPVKGETDKTAKRSNEDLRMKLWEILGTDPSPNEQNPGTPAQTPEVGVDNKKPVRHLNQKGNNVVKPEHNSDTRQMLESILLPIEQIPASQSQILEMGGKNSKSVGHLDEKGNKAVKLRQLSDTIETDTQSTNQTSRRPVTRSSTRKKAPAAVQLKLQHKVNNGGHAPPSLSHRGKYQKNIFSFDDAEGWSTRLCGTVDGSSSMLGRKNNERKHSRLAPQTIYLPKKDNPDMVLQVIDRRKTPLAAKRMILHGRIEGSHVSSPQADSKDLRAADMRKTPPPAEKDMSLPANDRETPPRSERMMSNGKMEGSEDDPSESERDILCGTDRRKTPPPVKRTMIHRNQKDASHNRLQNKTKCLQSTDRTTTLPAERTLPCTTGIESTHGCPPQNNRDSLQTKSGFLDDHLHFPPMRKKTNQQEKINSPPSPKNAQHQEGLRSPSSKKNILKDDFHTSMFGIKPSSPASEPMNQDVCISAQAERRTMVEGCCSLRTLWASKRSSLALNEQSESSHDTGELKKSSIRESFPTMGENGAEFQLSQSSEEQDAASLEEDLPITKGCRPTDRWSPGRPEKPPVMLNANKRRRDQEGIKICEIDPTSTPPEGTEEKNNGVQGPSDQNYEDGLERTVALFALSLERFKSKVKLQTSKKCSQILASVAERIQLQLQNVESQIQADVGKFTSLGKTKRKRLETRFQVLIQSNKKD